MFKMGKKLISFAFVTGNLSFATRVAANDLVDVPNLGDVANTLINGSEILTKLVLLSTLLIGAGFVIFAISMYQQHRTNPKMVPLDRPVLYFILGIGLCCIPFLGNFFDKTEIAVDMTKKQYTTSKAAPLHNVLDIDAPLEMVDAPPQ